MCEKLKVNSEKLVLLMAEKQLLTKDVCQKAGISPITLSSITNKKVCPRPKTVGKLANSLGVPVTDILESEV